MSMKKWECLLLFCSPLMVLASVWIASLLNSHHFYLPLTVQSHMGNWVGPAPAGRKLSSLLKGNSYVNTFVIQWHNESGNWSCETRYIYNRQQGTFREDYTSYDPRGIGQTTTKYAFSGVTDKIIFSLPLNWESKDLALHCTSLQNLSVPLNTHNNTH